MIALPVRAAIARAACFSQRTVRKRVGSFPAFRFKTVELGFLCCRNGNRDGFVAGGDRRLIPVSRPLSPGGVSRRPYAPCHELSEVKPAPQG